MIKKYIFSSLILSFFLSSLVGQNVLAAQPSIITQELIFAPKIKVVVPNGGEVWEKGKTYRIQWTYLFPLALPEEKKEAKRSFLSPFRVRIDLIKEDGSFVKKIAMVPAYRTYYKWRIPYRLPEGEYKIRVTLFRFPIYYKSMWKCKGLRCMPVKISSDESDRPFKIIGGTPGDNLVEVLSILQQISTQLQQVISMLQQMIS